MNYDLHMSGDRKTTIATKQSTRDELQALIRPGETFDDLLRRLADSYRSQIARRRMAWEVRTANDAKNAAAVARAERFADRLAALGDERGGAP